MNNAVKRTIKPLLTRTVILKFALYPNKRCLARKMQFLSGKRIHYACSAAKTLFWLRKESGNKDEHHKSELVLSEKYVFLPSFGLSSLDY